MEEGHNGPQAYAFEPVRDRPRPARNEPNVRPEARNEGLRRLQNLTWCLCRNCRLMPTVKESLCCHEIDGCVDKLDGNLCITEVEDFHSVCINKAVLRTTTVMMRYSRGLDAHHDFTNKTYRYTSYRSFTAWIHGGLGIRKVIPSCVVSAIRATYPSEDGNYKGYCEDQGEVDDALLL